MGDSRDPDLSNNEGLSDDDLASMRGQFVKSKSATNFAALHSFVAGPKVAIVPMDRFLEEYYKTQMQFFEDMKALKISENVAKLFLPRELKKFNAIIDQLNSLETPYKTRKADEAYLTQFQLLELQAHSPQMKAAIPIISSVMLVYTDAMAMINDINKRDSVDLTMQKALADEITNTISRAFQNLVHVRNLAISAQELYAKHMNIKRDDLPTVLVELSNKENRTEEEETLVTIDRISKFFSGNAYIANEAIRKVENTASDRSINALVMVIDDTISVEASLVPPTLKQLFSKSTLTNSNKVAELVKLYADTYMEGRTKTTMGNTQKSAELDQLEKLLMHAIDPSYDPKNSEMTPEEIILTEFSRNDFMRKTIVSHLFNRAMVDGIGNDNSQIYVNAVKAVVRLSEKGLADWNRLAAEKFSSNPLIKLPEMFYDEKYKFHRVKEAESFKTFDAINKNALLKEKIANDYYPQLIAGALAKFDRNTLTTTEIWKMHQFIIGFKESTQADPSLGHQKFLEKYIDLYISERIQDKKSPLLEAVEKAFVDFHETNKTVSKKTKNRDDALIFGTVKAEEKAIFAERLLSRALDTIGHQSRSQFVNTLKVVKRMGLQEEWDKLVAVRPEANGLKLAGNKTLGKDMSEKNINKFFDSLKTQPTQARQGFFSRISKVSVSRGSPSPDSSVPSSPQSPSPKHKK